MSSMMTLSYTRTGPRTGLLTAASRRSDASPYQISESYLDNDARERVMALVWLYDLFIYGSEAWGSSFKRPKEEHPFGELIRWGLHKDAHRTPRFHLNAEKTNPYPYPNKIGSALFDAANELIESTTSTYTDAPEGQGEFDGDFYGSVHITITFAHECIANSIYDVERQISAITWYYLDYLNAHIAAHSAPFRREEFSRIPNLSYDKTHTELSPESFQGNIHSATFSPHDALLLLTAPDGQVAAFSTQEFTHIWTAHTHIPFPELRFNAHPPSIHVFADNHPTQMTLQPHTGEPLQTVPTTPRWATHSSNQQRALHRFDTLQATLSLGSFANAAIIDNTDPTPNPQWHLTPDQNHCTAHTRDALVLWSLREHHSIQHLPKPQNTTAALSPDHTWYITAQADSITLLDTKTQTSQTHVPLSQKGIKTAAWSHNGQLLVLAGWDPQNQTGWVATCPCNQHKPILNQLTFSHTPHIYNDLVHISSTETHVLITHTHSATLYDLTTSTPLWTTTSQQPYVSGLLVESQHALLWTQNGEIHPFAYTTGDRIEEPDSLLSTLPSITRIDGVLSLDASTFLCYRTAWGQDGDLLYMLQDHETIETWDTKTHTLQQTIQTHFSITHALSSSPDGRFIAFSGSTFGRWGREETRILRAECGTCVGRYVSPEHEKHQLGALSWSSDGAWVALQRTQKPSKRDSVTIHALHKP